jgi:hypothetical protein
MGLDQYAFYARKEDAGDNAALNSALNNNEFKYWSKEYCIDKWMEHLYQEKGGEEVFNCQFLKIEDTDLDDLEKALKTEDFYDNGRFFFNESDDDEKACIKAEAENFITMARDYVKDDYDVYYTNWW